MADRVIVYPASIPLDSDLLSAEQDTMIAIGYALQAAYGQNTIFLGLACNPTSPASMQISIGPGAVIAPDVIESTPFGSLPADTTDPLIKMGINIASTMFTLTAPTTAGQSQNYLIEGSFSEADDTPATLTYFNSLNPNQPFSGPANSGTPQNTRRAQRCDLQLKVGVPANTGTQVTPPVDTGWYGLYVITVSYGQTSITGSSIALYPNAPFLAGFLASHHGGTPGQAPQINLATEVQGVLNPANLPSVVGSSLVYAGNPNGHVAGSSANGTTPPTMCWDTIDDLWWTCIGTGTATTATWMSANNSKNQQSFSTSGTFAVPPGITKVRVTCIGAGASGGGTTSAGSSSISVAAGGNAGCVGIGLYTVTPGQSIPVTVGVGGVWNATNNTSTNGGTSSFGTFVSAPGGSGPGANVPANVPPLTQGASGVLQQAVGGNIINGFETPGQLSVGQTTTNFISGAGGNCGFYGAGGNPIGTSSANGGNGQGYGAGGAGAATATSGVAHAGGVGANGAVIVEW